jgi:hypothetical protein
MAGSMWKAVRLGATANPALSGRQRSNDTSPPHEPANYPEGYRLQLNQADRLKGAMAGAQVVLAALRNGIVEIAGPERTPFNEIVARYLKAVGDPRKAARDPEARYFGGRVEERSLVPLGEARLGRTRLDEWLRRSQAGA